MEGQGSRRVTFNLIMRMMIMMMVLGSRVQGQGDCLQKCMGDCPVDPRVCADYCAKKCSPEPLYHCSFGCATSKCIDFTSEKLEGCLDSCSNNCKKAYAPH